MQNHSVSHLFKLFRTLASTNQTLSAIEHFYAEAIIQYENNETPIQGKQTLYELEQANLAKITNLRMEFKEVVIDKQKGKVWGEQHIYFTSKSGDEVIFKEAFFQQWEDGKIILQKFFYQK